MRTTAIVIASLIVFAAPAFAGPVVSPGGKPGAAKSWKEDKGTVVFVIDDAYDADDIAAAIQSNYKGAKATADGTKVVVEGVESTKALLAILEKVEVDPALDDVDEMLSSLKGGSDGDAGSGSSIRATKLADFSDVLGKQDEQIAGRIIGVTRAKFPLVILTVKLDKVPAGVRGVKKGDRITVVPRVKSRDGVIDPLDRASQLNVGAWYSQKGDSVVMRLGKKRSKKARVWIAQAFERKTK